MLFRSRKGWGEIEAQNKTGDMTHSFSLSIRPASCPRTARAPLRTKATGARGGGIRCAPGAKLPDAGKTPRSGVVILCHTEITMTTPVPIAKTTYLVLALGSATAAFAYSRSATSLARNSAMRRDCHSGARMASIRHHQHSIRIPGHRNASRR